MAKRSRRSRRSEKTETTKPDPTPTPQVESVKEKPAKEAPPTVAATSAFETDFGQEYYYVYTELRNVLIIAVVMFVGMFGLGYFI